MNKTLTAAQVDALAYVATHKGFISTRTAARATLKSLVARGVLVHHASTGYRHGEGAISQYKVTDAGRQAIVIGRMFCKLAA